MTRQWQQAHPERHAEDYARRVSRELPRIVVSAAVKAYKSGTPLHELARRFRVHPYTIRSAIAAAGVTIRPMGGPRKPRPKSERALQVVRNWAANVEAALARSAKRDAARLAQLDRRCECGGIIRPGVAHHCGRGA